MSISLEDLPRRVQEVDPNDGRCLVENTLSIPGDTSMEYCQVLPRHFRYDDDLMENLEWSWKMRKGTLNLDTRYNAFAATPSIKKMYEGHKFILIPNDDIVEKYYNSLVIGVGDTARERFPVYKEETFEYRLIPIVDMENIIITRHNNDGTVTDHRYPFDTLPKLVSHICPNFVLLAAGLRIRMDDISLRDMWARYPILKEISKVDVVWRRSHPWEGYLDQTFYPEYLEQMDDVEIRGKDCTSLRTAKGRGFIRPIPELPLPDGSCRSYILPTDTIDSDYEESCQGEKRNTETGDSDACFVLPEDKTRMWDRNTIAEWARNIDVIHVSDEMIENV